MPIRRMHKADQHRSRRPAWPGVPEDRRRIMRAIGPKDTRPERLVRSILHNMGYRFRVQGMKLPGRPDVVFSARRKVVFIHGCFWHAHGCSRSRPPRSRADYWLPKLADTKRRDLKNEERLSSAGWGILVLWECELGDPSSVADRLRRFLGTTIFLRSSRHQSYRRPGLAEFD